MNDKPRIVWHSNSPLAPTGYGQQSALTLPRLADAGFEVAASCFYGLEGAPLKWHGIPLLPCLGGDFGNTTLPLHAERFFEGDRRNGLVIVLADVWPFSPKQMRDLNLSCWVPIDHDPAPPGVLNFLASSGAVPIAMSRFGEKQMSHLDPLFVPHAVDTKVFKPVENSTAREGLPDGAFVVGMVAANKGRPSRKGFSQAFQAFAEFAEKHDEAYLYLHTTIDQNYAGGESIFELLAACDIDGDRVRIADQYSMMYAPYPPSRMAEIFSAFDVLLNPAFGEGFGIPILEAQACGVPVIVTDITAMPEVGRVGWHVAYEKFWSGLGSWQGYPYVHNILEALEACYERTDEQREQMAAAAREHALTYDADLVFEEHWLPTIEAAWDRLQTEHKPLVVPETRQWTVSIVTPWQDHPEFREAFDAAMKVGKPDEILIIDDGSKIPVRDAAFRFDEPGGFIRAVNKGLELATADVVVVLNNDIRHTRDDWLDEILAVVRPGVLCGELQNERHAWVDGLPVPYIDGWCLTGMRMDFERLEGFDPSFVEPAYYADNDLCVRATAGGIRLASMSVGLHHLLGGTSDSDTKGREAASRQNVVLYQQRVRALREATERVKAA